MLCDKCGKNIATVCVCYEMGGITIQRNLCDKCASGIECCDSCGSTFKDIAKNGRCGCPKCYEFFYKQLLPTIKKNHGSTKHIGKTINSLSSNDTVDKKSIAELRDMLNLSIKQENYEQAAVLRDKIREMEADI